MQSHVHTRSRFVSKIIIGKCYRTTFSVVCILGEVITNMFAIPLNSVRVHDISSKPISSNGQFV